MKIGDRVLVVKDVWDDGRNKSWLGWVGVVAEIERPSRHPADWPIYVKFPKARGNYRSYDFAADELRVI